MPARRRTTKAKKARPKARSKAKTRAKKPAMGKAWTPAEIRALRTGYKKKPASQIAKEMRRSLASVRGKISALGLTKGPAKRKTTKKKAKPKTKARRTTRAKAKPKARTKRRTRR